jgi:hypothetical protein
VCEERGLTEKAYGYSFGEIIPDMPHVFPASCLDAVIASNLRKVLEPASNRPPLPLFYAKRVKQFVEMVSGRIGELQAASPEEILMFASKKSALRYDQAQNPHTSKDTSEVFVKKEVYDCVKHVRCIVNPPEKFKTGLAAYQIPLNRALKNLPGWAPGLNYEELSYRVSKIAYRGCTFVEQDLSSCEARQGEWVTDMVADILAAVFPNSPDAASLYRAERRVKTKMWGKEIDYKGTLPSGSQFTTITNTLYNYFRSWCINGLDDTRFLVCGDDTIVATSNPASVNHWTTKFDKLTGSLTKTSTADYPEFLGRIFLDPHSPTGGHCDNPVRTMQKITAVVLRNRTPTQALGEKLRGVLDNNPNTPGLTDTIHHLSKRYYINLDDMKPEFGYKGNLFAKPLSEDERRKVITLFFHGGYDSTQLSEFRLVTGTIKNDQTREELESIDTVYNPESVRPSIAPRSDRASNENRDNRKLFPGCAETNGNRNNGKKRSRGRASIVETSRAEQSVQLDHNDFGSKSSYPSRKVR